MENEMKENNLPCKRAEEEGFEPPVRFPARQFSRLVH